MKPRTIAQVSWWFAALAVIALASLAEALLRSWPVLLLGAALALGGYALGRRHGGRRMTGRAVAAGLRHEVIPGRAVYDEDVERTAQLEAEWRRLRGLVGDLEDLAGRDIAVIIADYQHAQRQYGPAAAGKTGRKP